MSKAKQTKTSTEKADRGAFTTAAHRRLVFGTNVALMCVAALLIVIFLNYISFHKHWRKDMAVAGVFQPSDRTKRIVDKVEDTIRLTSIYTSDQEETSRDKYFPAVQDYCGELVLYAPDTVEVQHITKESEKANLLAEIQRKYGSQTETYGKAVGEFGSWVQQSVNTLSRNIDDLAGVLDSQGYLSQFPQSADLHARLRKHLKDLAETQQKVEELTTAVGLPRYQEAKSKITDLLDQMKGTLTAGKDSLLQIASLTDAAGPGGEEFFKTAGERMQQMLKLL